MTATEQIQEYDNKAKACLKELQAKETLTPKDKMALPRAKALELEPVSRRTSMAETNLGLTKHQAMLEASRCMQCKKPFCSAACPIGMPIPNYLQKVASGDFESAIQIIREHSLFPSICSRVCPHEKQCESNCAMGKLKKNKAEGLSLGNLERFCADYERMHLGGKKVPLKEAPTNKKIAIIGSGPAGLACAIDLAVKGHEVVIFESAEKLGGVLRYGIPEFRLPKEILDYEISILEKLGITIKTNTTVGKDFSIPDLLNKENFDAVFIGVGATVPQTLGLESENLEGIFTAEEYLRKANENESIDSREDVVIVGGGNVAMDAARMAYRLGAKRVRIVYRRTKEQMPACLAELEETLAEGVEICELRNPAAFIAKTNKRVSEILLDVFELGAPDEQGRARPVKVEGKSETIFCDTVVLAIGSKISAEVKNNANDLQTNPNGTFIVKEGTSGETTMKHVYVSGDAMHGPKTVVLAMKTGRQAALAIHESLV